MMNKNSGDHTISKRSTEDEFAAERKKDHIELALRSQIGIGGIDPRFSYEPILAAHPEQNSWPAILFSREDHADTALGVEYDRRNQRGQ